MVPSVGGQSAKATGGVAGSKFLSSIVHRHIANPYSEVASEMQAAKHLTTHRLVVGTTNVNYGNLQTVLPS